MGDDADRARGQLSRKRGLEADTTSDLAPVAEQAHAGVLGEHLVDRAVREDHHLVDTLRESAELRDRRGEGRMGRVDLLRDEHQPAHQK